MALTGGCYCGALRYEADGDPVLRAQCHCRACQYLTGGGPNYFMLMPPDGFRYTSGKPASYTRPDLPAAVTRDFCADCGTHVTTRRPGLEQVVIKVGTLDDPAAFEGPQMAIFCEDKQSFHILANDLPAFDQLPERS